MYLNIESIGKQSIFTTHNLHTINNYYVSVTSIAMVKLGFFANKHWREIHLMSLWGLTCALSGGSCGIGGSCLFSSSANYKGKLEAFDYYVKVQTWSWNPYTNLQFDQTQSKLDSLVLKVQFETSNYTFHTFFFLFLLVLLLFRLLLFDSIWLIFDHTVSCCKNIYLELVFNVYFAFHVVQYLLSLQTTIHGPFTCKKYKILWVI